MTDPSRPRGHHLPGGRAPAAAADAPEAAEAAEAAAPARRRSTTLPRADLGTVVGRSDESAPLAFETVAAEEPAAAGGPGRRWSGLLAGLCVGLLGVVGLVVAAQLAGLLAVLAPLPAMVRWPAYALAAALTAAAAWGMAVVLWRLSRLPVAPGLRPLLGDPLDERAATRRRAETADARRVLRGLLAGYDVAAVRGFFEGHGEAYGHLVATRDALLEREDGGDREWVGQFRDGFQSHLRDAADRCIKGYARRVGYGTAILPTGLLDTLVAVAGAYHMVGDLCRLYGLRPRGWQTTVILGRVGVNALLARSLEDWTDHAADQLVGHSAGHAAGHVGAVPAEDVTRQATELFGAGLSRRMAGRMLSGAAQGVANYWLLRRLGRYTLQALAPLGR